MLKEFDLSGRVAVVTGGNRGIGRGMALGFARAGADVVILARDEARTAAVVQELEELGRRALGIRCDVTRRDQVVAAFEKTVGEFGRLDIVVNNAGIGGGGSSAESHTDAEWDEIFAVNLKSAFTVAQAAYPGLAAAGRGKIINISSMQALMATENQLAYGAAKAGLVHLTTSLAAAWAHKNIQVNAILPGVVLTEITPHLKDPALRQRVSNHVLAGRIGEPEEFAGIAVFLASSASDYMTGQALVLDGGLTVVTQTATFLRD